MHPFGLTTQRHRTNLSKASGPRRRHRLCVFLGTCITILAVLTSGVRAQSFSIGVEFTAATLLDSGFTAADTMGSVGPNHIAVLINGRFSVHDKTGTPLLGKSLDQFWTDAGISLVDSFSFDPRILYDSDSQRWFATSVDNHSSPNNILLAVSASSDPTGTWTGFQIDSDSSDVYWADFPMMGINGDVVAVSASMLPIICCGSRTNILVVPKDDLTAPAPTLANATLVENATTAVVSHPAVDYDHRSLPLTMLSGTHKILNGTISRSNITGSPTTPTIEYDFPAFTTLRNDPPRIDQPTAAANVHAGDTRFSSNPVLQDGSLWAVHSVDVHGLAAIEWYEIDAVTSDVLQSGVISHPSLGFNFPSISVNDDKDIVIGFSGGDPNTFMSAYAVVGSTTAGVTSFEPLTQLIAGTAPYERLDGSNRNRWGDYSATVLDPLNDQHFWTFQEYAIDTDQWAIRVTQIIVPEPSSSILLIWLTLCLVSSQRSMPGTKIDPRSKNGSRLTRCNHNR